MRRLERFRKNKRAKGIPRAMIHPKDPRAAETTCDSDDDDEEDGDMILFRRVRGM